VSPSALTNEVVVINSCRLNGRNLVDTSRKVDHCSLKLEAHSNLFWEVKVIGF